MYAKKKYIYTHGFIYIYIYVNGVFQTQNKQTSAAQLDHFDFPKPKKTNKHPTNNVVQIVFHGKTLTKQFDHFSTK